MITGNLAQLDRLLPQVAGNVKKALELLKEVDVISLPNGKTPLDGEAVFASVNTYQTEPVADRRPEKHFRYIDIQILGAGRESIGYTDVENASDLTEDRREKDDVVFYGSIRKENFVKLEKGDFAIFFPWEVHRPNCWFGEGPETVKKIVVKVQA
ncbi:YhcH/YjgK/YiaL family protein [Acidaminococcus timonensis]|uniref:YhcH/YjgK/YiaL family protein n=1 Tax=Acidaminococcus timonensis TaxID=1871002 RepID=UPI0008DA1A65|nr:YhcH/YjgK/YiaL family protein [Acidaminococcus timonensis]